MRDIDAAAAKWSERLRSARADFLLQAAERRKTPARQSELKTSATTLHYGIVLAIVLIIAGVTYHISHSKDTNLQASPVDQVQNTAGGTVREPAGNTVGNLHEYKEDNWMKKNTPENSSSASLQGGGQSNDHITTVQDTLMTPVGDIVGDTVENMSGFTRNNKNTPENLPSASLQGVGQPNGHNTTAQTNLRTPSGGIIGDTVRNIPGFPKSNWERETTPEDSQSASSQGVGQSDGIPTTIQTFLRTHAVESMDKP